MVRVFSQKHSSTSVGNVGIYSVGTESVYQKWQFRKIERFTGISWEGLTRKTFAKTSCLHLVLTLCNPVMCRAHVLLCGMLTRELPMKTLQSSMPWVFTQSLSLPHTTLTNKSHMKYRVYKIEQNYNQIWQGIKANKNIVNNQEKGIRFWNPPCKSYQHIFMIINVTTPHNRVLIFIL